MMSLYEKVLFSDLVGTFFGPHEENSWGLEDFYSVKIMEMENVYGKSP